MRGEDCVKIHLVAAKKESWNVETFRRITGVDVRLKRFQIGVLAFLERELQFARVLKFSCLPTPFPIDQKGSRQFIVVPDSSENRFQTREISNFGKDFTAVGMSSFK